MRTNFIIPDTDITEALEYDPVHHSDVNFGSTVIINSGKYKDEEGTVMGLTPKKIRVWLGSFDRNDGGKPVNFFRAQLTIRRNRRDVPPTPPRSAASIPSHVDAESRSYQQTGRSQPDSVRSANDDDYQFVNDYKYKQALDMTDMKIALIMIERSMFTFNIAPDDCQFMKAIHERLLKDAPHDPNLPKTTRKREG